MRRIREVQSHVHAGPHLLQEFDEVLDILLEAEAAGVSARIAGIVPIRYANVMVRQHRRPAEARLD